jgi:hypothetical protein
VQCSPSPQRVRARALLKESAAYARGVGASLKGQVYDALKELAQGFLDERGNGLQSDPVTLKQIYDHSLIVLEWLLFILYAEARAAPAAREVPIELSYVRCLSDDGR